MCAFSRGEACRRPYGSWRTGKSLVKMFFHKVQPFLAVSSGENSGFMPSELQFSPVKTTVFSGETFAKLPNGRLSAAEPFCTGSQNFLKWYSFPSLERTSRLLVRSTTSKSRSAASQSVNGRNCATGAGLESNFRWRCFPS